jgi:hypothetical protein
MLALPLLASRNETVSPDNVALPEPFTVPLNV